MPTKSTSWTVGDKVFATLMEAQAYELTALLQGEVKEEEARVIVGHADAVIRIE